MIKKFGVALYMFAMAGQLATGQNPENGKNSSGNLLTGDVKAHVLQHYCEPGTLPKPDKIVIHDFAVPVGVISTDESIAGVLHRRMESLHGVDEFSRRKAL